MGTLRPNTGAHRLSAIRKSMPIDRSWPNPARRRPHEIADRSKYGKGITRPLPAIQGKHLSVRCRYRIRRCEFIDNASNYSTLRRLRNNVFIDQVRVIAVSFSSVSGRVGFLRSCRVVLRCTRRASGGEAENTRGHPRVAMKDVGEMLLGLETRAGDIEQRQSA
jgi:hypothetical protein